MATNLPLSQESGAFQTRKGLFGSRADRFVGTVARATSSHYSQKFTTQTDGEHAIVTNTQSISCPSFTSLILGTFITPKDSMDPLGSLLYPFLFPSLYLYCHGSVCPGHFQEREPHRCALSNLASSFCTGASILGVITHGHHPF